MFSFQRKTYFYFWEKGPWLKWAFSTPALAPGPKSLLVSPAPHLFTCLHPHCHSFPCNHCLSPEPHHRFLTTFSAQPLLPQIHCLHCNQRLLLKTQIRLCLSPASISPKSPNPKFLSWLIYRAFPSWPHFLFRPFLNPPPSTSFLHLLDFPIYQVPFCLCAFAWIIIFSPTLSTPNPHTLSHAYEPPWPQITHPFFREAFPVSMSRPPWSMRSYCAFSMALIVIVTVLLCV